MTEVKKCHRLKSLSVIGGFLDGMEIKFAKGLNCLIGHRGTGKTTVLEFIRYVLDEFPRDEAGLACRRRVEALVKTNLGDGRIRLAVETKDGLPYIVDRTIGGEPMVLTPDGKPTDLRINGGGIFSADIFSQNEVENIADSPQSQLALIDNFAAEQIADLNRQIAAARAGLDANAAAILPARQEFDALTEDVKGIEHVDIKLAALTAATAGDKKTDEVSRAHKHRALRDREQTALREAAALMDEHSQWLAQRVGQFTAKADRIFADGLLTGPNGAIVTAILDACRQLGGQLDQLFGQASAAIESCQEGIAELAGQLQHAHGEQELAFRDLIAKHNQAQGLANERLDCERKRAELQAKQRRHAEVCRQLDELEKQRAELTSQLNDLWNQRFALRREVAAWISKEVSSPIRVQIDQCGDTTEYQSLLASLLRGAVTQYNVAAGHIAQYVPPADLRRIVMAGKPDELEKQGDLTSGQATKAMMALGRPEALLQLDSVELADLPRIELKDGDEWKNSLRLSTGQKCTTILPILLLDSDNPLLVDQPEDNLDNRFIYDTVVNAIQQVKKRRQIVLITHNPNIPVLGEASQVYVLTSDGERASVANTGTVDDCKTEIVNLLEGGREAFDRRRERYGR